MRTTQKMMCAALVAAATLLSRAEENVFLAAMESAGDFSQAVTNYNGGTNTYRVAVAGVDSGLNCAWTLDGAAAAGEGASLSLSWRFADVGEHTVSCVATDGGQASHVATWNVTVKRRIFVSAYSTAAPADMTGEDESTAFTRLAFDYWVDKRDNAFAAAQDGDLIWVLPGTYRTLVDMSENESRMSLVLYAAEGRDNTILEPYYAFDPVCVRGDDTNNLTVVNFTLRRCGAERAILKNCLVTGFEQKEWEEGYYFDGTWRAGCFGGAHLENCLVTGNEAPVMFWDSTIVNCTIVSNRTTGLAWTYSYSSDVYTMNDTRCVVGPNCHVVNSIVRFNSDDKSDGENNYFCDSSYNDMFYEEPAFPTFSHSNTYPLPDSGDNVSASDPKFADPVFGDWRLYAGSPCLNAGDNAAVPSRTDFAGNPRIQEGTVDIGAFEGAAILAAPDSPPTSISVSSGNAAEGVRVAWQHVPRGKSYLVYRADSDDAASATYVGTTQDLFYDDTQAEANRVYWYFVKSANLSGESALSAGVSGWRTPPLVITTESMREAQVGTLYSMPFGAKGGQAPYSWRMESERYLEMHISDNTFSASDATIATVAQFDDDCEEYGLPFEFPFGGAKFNKVWINSNGTITFEDEWCSCNAEEDDFSAMKMIAVIWSDLYMCDGGVYVSRPQDDAITFRWGGEYYSGGAVNASATLYASGDIVLKYGAGNSRGGFVGVSYGDGNVLYKSAFSSLDGTDDIVFATRMKAEWLSFGDGDVATGLVPDVPTNWVTAIVTDSLGNTASREYLLVASTNDVSYQDVKTVLFDLGENGTRVGGGELEQSVFPGGGAMAPTVQAEPGWVFAGWDCDFTSISDDLTVKALYRTASADLHVDAISFANEVAAGGVLVVSWTLANTGNPSFGGSMSEKLSLVSAEDPDVIIDLATVSFSGTIRRNAAVERSASVAIPLRGCAGTWRLRVETGVRPSVSEYSANNSTVSEATVQVTPVPLPDLFVKSVSLDRDPAQYMPLDTVTVRYVVRNAGSDAAAPWRDRLYLCKDGTRVTLADANETEGVAAGGEVERVIIGVVPALVPLSGEVSFAVKVDCNDDVVEASDDSSENDVWESTPNATLGKRLYLSFNSPSVQEDSASGVRFYAKRSGETTSPLGLSLTAAGAVSSVSFPAALAIGAGASSAGAYVRPIDNSTIDGPRVVEFTLSSPGDDSFAPVLQTLTVTDDEVPSLYMAFDKTSAREGDEAIVVTVTREIASDEPLTVYLSGVTAGHCGYPPSVEIPAGEASVSFEMEIVDNDAAEVLAELTLRASASGYASATKTFTVEDDDVPGVTLSLYPQEVSEGAGANAAYAVLSRVNEDNIGSAITVSLAPSMPGQLIMQTSWTIPAYTMAIRFPIGVVDNGDDDGDRDVKIAGSIYIPSCGCSAQPSGGGAIEATLRIVDDDVPSLTLSASPSTMKEGLAEAGILTLGHNSSLAEDLVVSLSFDVEGEIDMPATVVIPAGEASVAVPVRTLDDGTPDGGKLVSVYAADESGAFKPASTWIQVSDQNLPDLKVSSVTVPAAAYAGGRFEIEFATENGGFAAASSDIGFAVHLVGGSRGEAATQANLAGTGKIVGGLAVGEMVSTSFTVEAPIVAGVYRVVVVVDPDGKTAELDKLDNSRTSGEIAVGAAYSASAAVVGEKTYLPGEAIVIAGHAAMPDGTTPAAAMPVEVYVVVNGVRRAYTVTTDGGGAFEMTFEPSSGEAGRYSVGACYPGVDVSSEQDCFDILGMRRSSADNIIWDYAEGDVEERVVNIQNRSGAPLTGLTATFVGLPDECGLEWALPDGMPANGSVALTLRATAAGVTEQHDYAKFTARIESAEGATLEFPLYFHSQTRQAYLRASPASVSTTMAVGHVRYIDVTISNDGKGDSGAISLSVPDARWLRVVGGTSLGGLASGESATVTLEVSPVEGDGLALNSPLSGGRLAVNCANGTGCYVQLAFTPVSESTGGISVDAVDNNTYYLESHPHLSNATVRVSNPYTGETVAAGTTDEKGFWSATGIPVGEYQLTVTAPRHDSYSCGVTVSPGIVYAASAFLQYQVVSATWSVVKSEIDDTYEIKLITEYETQVPAPVVKTSMPESFPDLAEGESLVFTIHAENIGLIRAEKIHFAPPDIEDHQFTFSDNDFALAAGEARDVAVKFEHLAKPRSSVRLGAKSTASDNAAAIATWLIGHVVEYLCNSNNWYIGYNQFSYGATAKSDAFQGGTGGNFQEIVLPEVLIIGNPSRDRYEEEEYVPDNFIEVGFVLDFKGCNIPKCLEAVAGCLGGLIINSSPVVGCATGLIDCGLGMQDAGQSSYKRMMANLNCANAVAGCVPALGTISAAAGCVLSIYDNCIMPIIGPSRGRSGGRQNASVSSVASVKKSDVLMKYFPVLATGVAILGEELPAIRDWNVEFYGDGAWLDCNPEERVAFLDAVRRNFPAEGELLDAEAVLPCKPSGISDAAVRRFVDRLNASLQGVECDASADAGKTEAIRSDFLAGCSDKIAMCEEIVAESGYSSLFDLLKTETDKAIEYVEYQRNSVCASVKLELSQTMAMTREAFDGTLTMYNGNPSSAITDLRLDISVLDEDGNECKDLFEVFANGTAGDMSEGSVLDGGLSVAPGGTGSAFVRFVPERIAAPTTEKKYSFGGAISYTDPFSGETATATLAPVSLTVSPSPYLHLDYFVQRDVFADDPFTADIVEASMPAEMAVLVRNVGAGDARNVTISSARPEVVQNDKGFASDFDLKDYSLDSAALNGSTAHLGLNAVSLGTVASGASKVVQWWLTSSIEGHFVGMSATVAPVNTWNTPDTALVDPDVGVHKLVRSVVADADALPDFLTSGGADLYGTPDEIYTASGNVLSVHSAAVAAVGEATSPVGAEVALQIEVTPSLQGWNYGYIALPGLFRYNVSCVERGGGGEIPLRNAWITDRTFRDGGTPLLEERLHLVDEFEGAEARTYVVHLSAKPSDAPEVSGFDVEGGTIEYVPRDAVTVVFSKAIDAATFTAADDIVLRKQGAAVADLSGLSISAADETGTAFEISGLADLCGETGRYELVVQCAGIADLSGQPGVSGKSVSWTLSAPDSPYILDAEGRPTGRVRGVDWLTAVTSVPVTEDSAQGLVVTLNGADVTDRVSIEAADGTLTRFSIGGLGELQTEDGEYSLVIDGTGLVGVDCGSGVEAYTVSWTRDTTPPVLNGISCETGLGGTSFLIELSEDADPATISIANVSLLRGGAAALPESARLKSLGGGRYSVTGLDAAIAQDGEYTFSFDATGVADEAGNEASGVRSLTWTVDRTAPAQVSEIEVSPGRGSSDTCIYTASRSLTIGGTVLEAGLSVQVLARYAAGAETLLAEPEVDGEMRFLSEVELPGDGSMTVVLRLADAYGNQSDTEFDVYVDVIALSATISGAPGPDEPAGTLTIAFSATPEEALALAATMTLERDGVAVAIPNVSVARTGERTYAVSGLAEYTSGYGSYVFTYDVREVSKESSGVAGDAVASATWSNYPLDTTPPAIEEVRFDGAAPASAYVQGQMFSEVSVRFSEAVNVPDIVERGVEGQAFYIQFLSAAGGVEGTLRAADVAWDADTFTARWTIDPAAVPCGRARLVVDPSLVRDAGGNALSAAGPCDQAFGSKTFSASVLKRGVAHSYACPALCDWNSDGLLDLVVGEKTEDLKGKVRIYLNRGTATAPEFDDFTYLQKDGEDVEFVAQGCVGVQVSFGRATGATMFLATSQGEIYGWRHRARRPKAEGPHDWELWFSHLTDERFSSLIRTQTSCHDIDGDGWDEVIVSGQNSRMFWMKRNVAGETECTPLMDPTGASLEFPEGQNHTSAVLTDVNGDTTADLATGDTDGNVWVYYGTGGGRFAATPERIYDNPEASNKRSRLAVGDIDGDGVEDLLVGRQDGSVLLLKGVAAPMPVVNFRCVEIKSPEQALSEDIFWVDAASGWVSEQSGDEAQVATSHEADGETTVLAATFYGPGTVTFTWSVAGDGEASEFTCSGGEPTLSRTGAFAPVAQSVSLAGEGLHEVSWTFAGRNKAVVRDVAFAPAAGNAQRTTTSGAPVDFADIRTYANEVWRAKQGDYEAAANEVAANGRPVWENCVAGLDSSDPDAEFKATISVEGGVPKISWVPALNGESGGEGVKEGSRRYTVYGKADLQAGDWLEVTPENKAAMKFFKVTVGMPQ